MLDFINQVFIVSFSFSGSFTPKYISLNNQTCVTRPTLNNQTCVTRPTLIGLNSDNQN